MQVQDTDLKLLRIFETIVRCGGFAAAQPILNIGASSISEYMSQLETRLGLRLCERGRAGFRLTEEGAELHAAAQRLLGGRHVSYGSRCTAQSAFRRVALRHDRSDVDRQVLASADSDS